MWSGEESRENLKGKSCRVGSEMFVSSMALKRFEAGYQIATLREITVILGVNGVEEDADLKLEPVSFWFSIGNTQASEAKCERGATQGCGVDGGGRRCRDVTLHSEEAPHTGLQSACNLLDRRDVVASRTLVRAWLHWLEDP